MTTQQSTAPSTSTAHRTSKLGRNRPSPLHAGRNIFGYALLAPQTLGMLVVGLVAIGGLEIGRASCRERDVVWQAVGCVGIGTGQAAGGGDGERGSGSGQ